MRKVKLFCFPYAGGSAYAFNKWKPYLDSAIELRPVELAGRGMRIHDPLYNDMPEMVDDVFHMIKEEISVSMYALFGHSMGSTIAYKLSEKIRQHYLPAPVHIFFSGKSAPHKKSEKEFHLMNDADFRNEIIQLGGTPPEFFEYPELMQIFLPVLKNDFKIVETDRHTDNMLDVDISVFTGRNDELAKDDFPEWEKHTKKACNIYHFEGGHFFLHDQVEQVVKLISNVLLGKPISNRDKIELTD